MIAFMEIKQFHARLLGFASPFWGILCCLLAAHYKKCAKLKHDIVFFIETTINTAPVSHPALKRGAIQTRQKQAASVLTAHRKLKKT
jgi:hypothetical protein